VAAQRNAAWKDVARRIAHEIKNPLTPIQLSAERLRRKYRKEIVTDLDIFDRCTETIIRQVGDIGRMVDEFSAFARMPAPVFAETDLTELLRQSVFSQRVASPELIVEMAEPAPEALLVCDGRMVGQALANILKNAAEAVSARLAIDGGEAGQIHAALRLADGAAIIEITDNGIGLPAKDRERLTEPYVTTREKGTGLGLAIVKRILEDHGGELRLTDATDSPGARAILKFPTRTSAERPDARAALEA
jgi:two-component system nitrogen regulation sensor histidine kinase NtrY